jgi:DNA-binding response OmpR family regulator
MSNDRAALLLYQSILELDGYSVVASQTAHEALRIFKRTSFDCVVIDHETEGTFLVERIARRRLAPAVIFVTDRSEIPLRIYSKVEMFIAKEEAIENLSQRMRDVLRPREGNQNEPDLSPSDDDSSFLHPAFLRWLLPW